MTTYALRRPRLASQRRRAFAEAAGGVAVAAVAAALTWFVTTESVTLALPIVIVGGVSLWLATTRRTALALALFMVYIGALDGYVKLASGWQVLTFLRDVLLFSIVIGLLVRAQVQGRKLTPPPLTAWVVGFVLLVVVQVANPQGGTFAHSLAGVRQHLEFVPLFFLCFAFVRTTNALRVFVVLTLLLATANGIASWVQLGLTPEQMAAWGPGYAERVLGEEEFSRSPRTFEDEAGKERVRPFGLGPDAGSGGIAGVLALGGIAAMASLVGRARYLLFAVAMAAGAVTAIFTSQGRGVVVCGVVIVVAYGLLIATSRGRTGGVVGLAVAAAVSLIVIQALVDAPGASTVRYEGLAASQIVTTTSEARPDTVGAIWTAVTSYPFGAGLATAGPASSAPGGTDLASEVNAESELSFLTIETGVPGMLLLTSFTALLFVLALRNLRREPDREARVLLAAIIAPIAGLLALYYPSVPTASTPTGPYLWAVAGIVSYWLIARPAARRRSDSQAASP
jgi:hypothetical protein